MVSGCGMEHNAHFYSDIIIPRSLYMITDIGSISPNTYLSRYMSVHSREQLVLFLYSFGMSQLMIKPINRLTTFPGLNSFHHLSSALKLPLKVSSIS